MEESVFGLLSEKYVGEAPRDLPDHDTQEMDMNLSTRSVGHLEQSVEGLLLAACTCSQTHKERPKRYLRSYVD